MSSEGNKEIEAPYGCTAAKGNAHECNTFSGGAGKKNLALKIKAGFVGFEIITKKKKKVGS